MDKQTNRPQAAWLFDIDGVLTDPELKRIKHHQIVGYLADFLERGEPVWGNTGRSLDFALEYVVKPIEQEILQRGKPQSLLKNIGIIGEKGGAWIAYNGAGEKIIHIDESLATDAFKQLQGEVRNLVEQQFSDTMFFDPTKKTMISIEMNNGETIENFKLYQGDLLPQLRYLLRQHNLEDKFKIDATRIATDIESPHVGKALGTKIFLEMLNKQGTKPEKFYAFGDSLWDYAMAEELHKQKLPVEFIFVGDHHELQEKETEGIHVTMTQGYCDNGTLEYLEKILEKI